MFNNFLSHTKVLILVLIFAVLTLPAFGQNRSLRGELERSFKRYNLIQLDNQEAVMGIQNKGFINVSLENRAVRLILEQHDLRSRIYRAEDMGFYGARKPEQASINTYRGQVANEKESQVRLTIDTQRIEGFIVTQKETFFIEPANRYSSKATPGQLVVYKKQDFLGDKGFACPSDLEEKIEYGKTLIDRQDLAGLEGPGVIELATEADFEYVNALGGAVAANAEIMNILNMVDGTFDSELDLTIQVTFQHTWSTQDPFNGAGASTLLSSFQNHWNTDASLSEVPRDAAHLFSAKPAVLSMGYAMIGTICRVPGSAYGLSGRIDWAPAKYLVTAHELGHNLDATHVDTPEGCGSTIMNPVLSGSTSMSFCPLSKTQISTHNGSHGSCLAPPAIASAAAFDFDGDEKTDTAVYRPNGGEWWYLRSSDGGSRAFQFGKLTDKMVPADYTGDGVADVAFWRIETGEWYILRSEDSSFFAVPFGALGDIPAPGDYDGDGTADFAVFRPNGATWYIANSSGGSTILQHGADGDIPVVSDYDGDGTTDVAVFRPGASEWWIRKSTGGVMAMQFGSPGDKPVAADYTGDGKTDVAFWRPSTGEWFVLRSEDSSFYAAPFGTAGDIPVPGDYDGDGFTDFAIWRPLDTTWYLNRSQAGFLAVTFGAEGDLPVPSAYIP